MIYFTQISSLFQDLFRSLFPDLCLACNRESRSQDAWFCVQCLHDLPFSDHFKIKDNTVMKHFYGRIPLHHGAALLTFRQGSMVQHMLHRLKYTGNKEIGEILGVLAGQRLSTSTLFLQPDIIIPVPIHYKKQQKRGYNQSSVFGQSVGKTCNIPFHEDVLIKTIANESQTGKTRSERVENVSDVFVCKRPELVHLRHVLIVDDVVTTGATLEACCHKIMSASPASISILTIAATKS
ncbi:MAG: ComF family protein [Saprospiraceae bacterium]|nr:ComF family protein [Saprospiraceae bacterium]MCZ2340066.1 hypothetical protein [Chitinophagales bacterium]